MCDVRHLEIPSCRASRALLAHFPGRFQDLLIRYLYFHARMISQPPSRIVGCLRTTRSCFNHDWMAGLWQGWAKSSPHSSDAHDYCRLPFAEFQCHLSVYDLLNPSSGKSAASRSTGPLGGRGGFEILSNHTYPFMEESKSLELIDQ